MGGVVVVVTSCAVLVMGCAGHLADRCWLDSDCGSGRVCSNDGDRSRQGFCVESEEAGVDGNDGSGDVGADADGGGEPDAEILLEGDGSDEALEGGSDAG